MELSSPLEIMMSLIIQTWIDELQKSDWYHYLSLNDRSDALTNSMLRTLKKKKQFFKGYAYMLSFEIKYHQSKPFKGMHATLTGRIVEWRGSLFDGVSLLNEDPQKILEARLPAFYHVGPQDQLTTHSMHRLPQCSFDRYSEQSHSIYHLTDKDKEIDKKVAKAFVSALNAEKAFLENQTPSVYKSSRLKRL